MEPAWKDQNRATGNSRTTMGQQLSRLGRRLWTFLTWGRWTAIGLFIAAFIAALWLKHNWVNAPVA